MDWNVRLERKAGIEVRAAPDGVVVYDSGRDRVHYLNRTAALLLEICDGKLRAADLPPLLAAAFELEAEPTDDVEACVARLLDEGLLVPARTV